MEEEKKFKMYPAAEKRDKIHKQNIPKQFLLIPAALLLCIILLMVIFQETDVVVKHEADKMGNTAARFGGYIDSMAGRKGVCFDNLLLLNRLMIYDGGGNLLNVGLYLCIFNTGDVYGFEDSEKGQWQEYYYPEAIYDDEIWADMQNIFYFGRLPQEEIILLNQYVDSYDPEGKRRLHLESYNGWAVDDGLRIYQGISFYWHEQPERYGKKDDLIEMSELNFDQNGGYEKYIYLYSLDENAIAAIGLLKSSGFYDRWMKMCLNTVTNENKGISFCG